MNYGFIFEIEPQVKQRPRFNSITKRTYTPSGTRVFEYTIGMMAKKQMLGRTKLTGPLFASVEFEFQKTPRSKLTIPRGDLDNFLKSFLDSLNDIVYEDDSQIVGLGATKSFGPINKITLFIKDA